MNRQEFNELAERILHSIITSPRATPKHMSAVDLAIQTTAEFRTKLTQYHMELGQGELEPDEIMALQANKKIEAIKLVRMRLGINLKDAKEIVDREQQNLGL